LTLVKICGVASAESVAALDGLADYLGFVASKTVKTGRTLEPAAIAALAAAASRSRRVAVLHGYTPREAASLAGALGVDVLQLHTPTPPGEAALLAGALEPYGVRLAPVVEWRGSGWAPMDPCSYMEEYSASGAPSPEYILLDAAKGFKGGIPLGEASGALPCAEAHGYTLGVAGGLRPGGPACEAARLGFHLVDVSRGVEEAPGVKSPLLSALLIWEARRCGGDGVHR